MDELHYPPWTVTEEEMLMDDLEQFSRCDELIRKIAVETAASISDVTHTHSDAWGFVMRGHLSGVMLHRFVCWYKPEEGTVEFWIG